LLMSRFYNVGCKDPQPSIGGRELHRITRRMLQMPQTDAA
jgi:hypothetical protein